MISIVIPAYNAQKKIEKCVRSIISNTYKDFEIIIVDDGSTDDTCAIIDSLKIEDSRIKVIKQRNKGVSNARNVGVSHAVGEYITFIDADDYIDKSFLYDLYDPFIEKPELDVVIGGVVFEDLLGEVSMIAHPKRKLLSYLNACKTILMPRKDAITWSVWGNLYKTTKLKDIKFDNHIRYGEDMLFWMKLLALKPKVYMNVLNGSFYHYIEHGESTVHNIDVMSIYDYLVEMKCVISKGSGLPQEILYACGKYWIRLYYHLLSMCFYKEKGKWLDQISGLGYFAYDYLRRGRLDEIYSERFYSYQVDFGGEFYKKNKELYTLYKLGKKLYIYGSGTVAKYMYDYFGKMEIAVESFVISDDQKKITRLDDVDVIWLDELNSLLDGKCEDIIVFIAIMPPISFSIRDKLKIYGYRYIYMW